MKKVLFVATITKHIKTFHVPYLKWFKEQGYEVHVASKGNETIEYCDKHFDIPFERFPLKPQNIKAYKQLKNIIEENKYEIIHCHTPVGGVLTRLAARKARKKYNTKVIYTAHGFHFYDGAPKKNWMIYYPIEKWLSKYTDCLITINEEDYNRAKSKFKKAKKIKLVHGVGVDEYKFKQNMTKNEKINLRKELGIEEDDFVIIYPAELSKRKNQGMLIRAISLLSNKDKIKILLAGKDSYKGKYQKLTKELGLEKQIVFLGFRTDICKLMQISNMAVSTSRQEGLPVNIMEAMFMGLPIIATDCRGNNELIKENLVQLDDEKELAKLVNSCIEKYKENNNISYPLLQLYKLENVKKEMEKSYKGE